MFFKLVFWIWKLAPKHVRSFKNIWLVRFYCFRPTFFFMWVWRLLTFAKIGLKSVFLGFVQIWPSHAEKTTREAQNTAGMQQGIALKLPKNNCTKKYLVFGLMKIWKSKNHEKTSKNVSFSRVGFATSTYLFFKLFFWRVFRL